MTTRILSLGDAIFEALNTREDRALSPEERGQFYREFNAGISQEIEKIRETQRRASEDLKNLTLA